LRLALLAPSIEGLDAQLPALQDAVSTLQRFGAESPGAGFRPELEALARDLRAIDRLIERGLAFQQGLARLLASSASGYQPDGEPVSLKTAGSLSVQG